MRLADAHELLEGLEVIDVEDAIQMVDLVLQGSREQLVALDPELAAVAVTRLHGDFREAPRLRHVARD